MWASFRLSIIASAQWGAPAVYSFASPRVYHGRTFQLLQHVTQAVIHRPEPMHWMGFQVEAHVPRPPGAPVASPAWRDGGYGSQRGAFPSVGVHPREQPGQTRKRPSQLVEHRDDRCGPAGALDPLMVALYN